MAEAERDGGKGTKRSYDAVIVGGSLAGCAAATMLGRAGARVAVLEKSPDPATFKQICSHFIQASAVPTLERMDLLEPMMDGGRGPLALSGARAVGVDRSAAGAGRAQHQPAPATPRPDGPRDGGVDPRRRPAPRPFGGGAAPRRRQGERRRGARPRRCRDRHRSAADDRRRRPRLDHRQDLRGQGQDLPARSLRLRRLLRRRRAERRARRIGLADGPRLGGGLPHRRGPHLHRRDADQGAAARVQGRPWGGAGRLLRGGAGSALAAGRAAGRARRARQDRHDEPDADPDRARPGADRRRGARHRPALRRRLRLGVPVGRMAGRLGGAGAARRRGAGRGPASLPAEALAPPARPRLDDPRLRDRPEAAAAGADDLLRRRARPAGGGDLRRLRDAADRRDEADRDRGADGGPRQRPLRAAARRSEPAHVGAGVGSAA